ncbi:MAG: hypothetical protein JNL90_12560 [Planctomycetes bacterium]|nr:hypothetical protein [Planctomycetota bacterium]
MSESIKAHTKAIRERLLARERLLRSELELIDAHLVHLEEIEELAEHVPPTRRVAVERAELAGPAAQGHGEAATLTEAIDSVLSESRRVMTVPEILDELSKVGRAPGGATPKKQIRNTLERHFDKRHWVRIGDVPPWAWKKE